MNKIKSFIEKNKYHSTTIIRISLALVLLWFGIGELLKPESWFSYIPPWLSPILPIAPKTFILLHGTFETIIGLFLLIGLFTRITAFIAFLHLLSVAVIVGFNDIGVRDFGLAAMALSLVFSGSKNLSLDNKLIKKTI